MNMRPSTNLKFKRMLTDILSIFAILAIAFPVTGSAYAQEPNPWFSAFPPGVVEGWDWPLGALVHLTIDDPDTAVSPDYEQDETVILAPWGSGQLRVWFEFPNAYNMKPGDIVTLTDGITPRTHVVQNLSITAVDPNENTVVGIADGGRSVSLWSWEDLEGRRLETTADELGNWSADFDDVGFDLMLGYHVRAEVWDAGNATAVDWYIPNPYFQVQLETNHVDGWEWMPNGQVTININGMETATVPTDEWGTFRSHFEDMEPFVPGMDFVITDGVSTKTITTAYLEITKVDPDADTVSGKANAGQTFNVWVHGPEDAPIVQVTADAKGRWIADFSGQWNIVPGSDGAAQIDDQDRDGTWVPWRLPNPRMVVFPEWEWFDGIDWPDGASVKITVKGKPECKVEKESWGGFFNGSFGEGCDVAVGDKVKFTDGKTSLTHVVRNLAITAVDPVEDTITGIADIGTLVYVWPHDGWFEPLQTIADDSGVWQVDLGDVGYDLQEGASGRSEIRDDLGDATAVDWYIPNPYFQVQLETNHVDGWEWTPNGQVTISINGVEAATVQTDEWGTFRSHFEDMEPFISGMDFLITDGPHTKTLTTAYLEITNVDPDADTVSGRADAGQTFNVWVHGPENPPTVQVTTDTMGQWTADFSGQWNIVPGSDGAAQIDDQDRDGTWVPWRLPNPRFTIFPLWQWYDGLDWPDGATVNITVAGKPACGLTKTSWGGFFNGGFPRSCSIEIGDTITFADDTATRTHVVRDLAITAIDLKKDTISGTADAGTTVYVWPHDGWFEPLPAIANNSGAWQVDLGDVGYDLLEGASGRAEIRDDMGNATAVDWNLNARLVVQITDDWFRAEGFAPDTSLKFRIYDAPGGNLLLKSKTAKTDSGGTVTRWMGDQVDVVPGNYVIVTDGKTTRDMVLEALTFDLFDTSLGILQGTAPEPFGRTVSVGIGCWQRDDLTRDTTTDENGVWIVDFHTPVPNDFGCVFAWIYDAVGNVSEVSPEQIIWWSE